VDVLRHHPSPRGSGDRRCCSYPAMEEVTPERDLKPKISAEYIYCFPVCVICVVRSHSSIACTYVHPDKCPYCLPFGATAIRLSFCVLQLC
jgi:hypothetical protein